jgi:hypothetical protein
MSLKDYAVYGNNTSWALIFRKSDGAYVFENLSNNIIENVMEIMRLSPLRHSPHIQVQYVNERGDVYTRSNIDDFIMNNVLTFLRQLSHENLTIEDFARAHFRSRTTSLRR